MPYSSASEKYHLLSSCAPASWVLEQPQSVTLTAMQINNSPHDAGEN
jgi:hypothetical protein